MKRMWILFRTEFLAWRHDPITALGGFIPTVFILLAFGLLFGGRLTLKLGLVNQDQGPYGDLLQRSAAQVESPFGTPYYDVYPMDEPQALQAYREYRVDGFWVIPEDFSDRISAGDSPLLQVYINNYNDDRAKNQRLYPAEVLWDFYQRAELPPSPLILQEEYPRPEMVEWFPIISVGVALLGFMIGGMMNVFMLTDKETSSRVTLEFGLAPRSLLWVLIPKTMLALLISLLTGTALLGLLSIWPGVWAGPTLPRVWLLALLVTLFWVPLTTAFGLRGKYFSGAIAVMLTALTTFFIGGGLSLVRVNRERVPWISWLFPNTYAVDPLRDLVLFHQHPADWTRVLIILISFAAIGLVTGWGLAVRQLRRTG